MTPDDRLRRLEKWLRDLYRDAEKEMRGKWDEYMSRQEKRADKLLEAVREAKTDEAKKAAEEKYRAFLKSKTSGDEYYRNMVSELARQYANAGRRAAEIVNGERYEAFADGYNFSAGEINKAAIDGNIGIRFDLCDAGTIEQLAEHREDLLLPPKADPSKVDLTVWNVHNINAQVTQGIVQGESIPKIAARLGNVTHMNEVAAVRTARTMTTAAENAGRVQNMQTAEAWGVKTRKRWMCTLDSRTRDSHLKLDGETAENDAAFSNGCRYPGDPNGPAEECYNCRCTLMTVVDGFSSLLPKDKQGAVRVSIDGEELERGKNYMITPKYGQEGIARKMLEERLKKREERAKKQKTIPMAPETRQDEKQAAAEELTGWDKVKALRTAKPAAEMSSAELKEIGRAFYESEEYKALVKSDPIDKEAAKNEYETLFAEYKDAAKKVNSIRDYKKYKEESEKLADLEKKVNLARMKASGKSAAPTATKEDISRLIAEARGESRGFASEDERNRHLGRNTEAKQAVAEAYGRYPASWVKKSVEDGPLSVKKTQRGYYLDSKGELAVSGSGNDAKNTAIHEIGHRMERVQGLLEAERRYYNERTAGEKLSSLGAGYAKTEKTRKDEFVNAYMGKDYGGSGFELLSMGLEGVIGYTGHVDLSKDEDMRDWITGILLAY